MTDPGDFSGDDRDRDDDAMFWDRGPGRRAPEPEDDEPLSTREQLARLKDGLSRSARAGGRRDGGRRAADPAPGDYDSAPPRRRPAPDFGEAGPRSRGGLPDPIDRAIDKVGDVFGGLGRGDQTPRDPYAEGFERDDPYEQDAPYAPRDPYAAGARDRGLDLDPYDAVPAEPEDYGAEPAPTRRRRGDGAPRGYSDSFGEEADRRGGGRPDKRDRRAARAQKGGFGRGEDAEEPARLDAAGRDPGRDAGFAEPYELDADEPYELDAPPGAVEDEGFDAPRGGDRAPGALFAAGFGAAPDPYEETRPAPKRRSAKADRAPTGFLGRGPAGREAEPEEAPAPRRSSKTAPRPATRSRGGEDLEDGSAAEIHRPAARPKPGAGAGAFGSLERMLAGRYLRARRKEGFISVIAMLSLIGITLAVAVLIVVMSVMNGFRAELIDKIVGVNGHLIVTPVERGFDDYEASARAIRTVPGVTRAAPLIEGQAFATSARGGVGVMVRGLAKPDLLSLERVSVTPEQSVGSLAAYGDGSGVAIGAGLARRLGVTVGDTLNVISPQGSVTPFGVAPKRRSYDVIYVFKMGMSNYDDVLLFMPIEEAQTFFSRQGSADFVEVKVATPDRLDGYKEDIEAAASRPVVVTSWQESNGVFIGALETEQSVMFLILSMLILIASLIIISGLIMLVKEKGPDIAILRTMGLSRGGVMRVFFMCGATIGLVGAALGVTLGVLVALNVNDIKLFVEGLTGAKLFPSEVYLFSSLPSRLDWGDVGFTILITLGLSFLATLYPAWRAARMDPVEALRYE